MQGSEHLGIIPGSHLMLRLRQKSKISFVSSSLCDGFCSQTQLCFVSCINVVLTAGQHSRHNMARPSPTPSHLDHCCCQPDQDTSIRRAPVLGPSSRAPIMDMLNNIVMLIFIICFRSAFQYISQCFPVFNLSVSDMVAERLRLREGMIAI